LGAGCAGLSLLMRMLRSGQFDDKKILLIDREAKTKNDRTWCFWETGNGFFEDVVCKKWDTITFFSNDYSATFPIEPYRYKMVRGIEFYRYCFDEIRRHPNVEIVYGDVKEWEQKHRAITLKIDDKVMKFADEGTLIFNSIYHCSNAGNKTIRLLQHFKGWIIETPSPFFNEQAATMMDFRVHQAHGTSFAYLLPLNKNRALVEYTLVTKELLQAQQYDQELSHYIKNILGLSEYAVTEEEFGAIPMTNEKFQFSGNGWQIGTAGGQTKASTGYTFQFIQKQSEMIVDCLLSGKSLKEIKPAPGRFRFYDNTLLHILYHNTFKTDRIFSDLFKKNKPQQVLRFLDNESSIIDELKIIASLPPWPFLKAAWHQL
jgi:lycopene beta-cyclase